MTDDFPPCDLLIASVGTRDPIHEGELTGPARSVEVLQPRVVVLLWNAGVATKAEATRAWITNRLSGIRVEMEEIEESIVADVNALQPAVGDVLRRVRDRHASTPAERIAVCPSSGTPQIESVLMMAAEALLPGSYQYQALDPKKTQGPLLRQLDPNLLRHVEDLRAGFTALARCNFAEALVAFEACLSRRTAHLEQLAPQLRIATAVAKTLHALGHFELEQARTHAGEMQVGAAPPEAAADLHAMRDWVIQLEGGSTVPWATELASLAHRTHKSGRRVESHVSAATALEVAGMTRLKVRWGVDTEALTTDQLDVLKKNKDFNDAISRHGEKFKVRGAENVHLALMLFEPEYKGWSKQQRAPKGGGRPVQWTGVRKAVAEHRNKAVHEGQPLPVEFPDLAFEYLDALFEYFGWGKPTDCPTSPARIDAIARALARSCGITLR